jgi:hypothetical protein
MSASLLFLKQQALSHLMAFALVGQSLCLNCSSQMTTLFTPLCLQVSLQTHWESFLNYTELAASFNPLFLISLTDIAVFMCIPLDLSYISY